MINMILAGAIGGYKKYVIAGAIALAVAGCVGVGWYVQGLRAENTRLAGAVQGLEQAVQASTELRAAEQVIAQKHSKEIAALKQQKGILNAKLKAALAAEPSWSDQVVPSGVTDALGL